MQKLGVNWGKTEGYNVEVETPCNELNPPGLDTIAAYMILNSAKNYNLYLDHMRDGLSMALQNYSILDTDLQKTFYPGDAKKNILLQRLLGGAAMVGAIACAWAGPVGLVSGAIAGAALNTFKEMWTEGLRGFGQSGLPANTADLNTQHLIDFNSQASIYFGAQQTYIDNMRTGFMSNGVFGDNKVSTVDLFADGAWADQDQIAVLTTNTDPAFHRVSPQELRDYMFKMTAAMLINYSWKKQGTYIAGIKTTEADCNTLTYAGDDRFRTYYKGYCYFLQRIRKTDNGPNLFKPRKWEQDTPQGWGEIDKAPWSIKISDAIKSSVDAYDIGGIDYDPTQHVTDVFGTATKAAWDANAAQAGIWTLPVGRLDATELKGTDYTKKEFWGWWICKEGKYYYNSYKCYCPWQSALDKNGKRMSTSWAVSEKDAGITPDCGCKPESGNCGFEE